MSYMISRFAPFQFASALTSVTPPSEMEEFATKARALAKDNRLPLMRRIRAALGRLLPAGPSAIVAARQSERHLLLEIKRLEMLSSHLVSDIGYMRTASGDYVLETTASGKRPAPDTSTASVGSRPANTQIAA